MGRFAFGGRRDRVPVPVRLDVRATGEGVVLDPRLVSGESPAGEAKGVASLTARRLMRPALAEIEGNPGCSRVAIAVPQLNRNVNWTRR